MKNLLKQFSTARELRRLARENNGKDLSVMDDVVFKAMLSPDTEDAREALRSLLSACTRRKIASVRVLNNDLVPVHLDAKTARLDVHVTFNDGEAADLEMQAGRSGDDLKRRAEYYSALLLAGQQPRGKPYRGAKRVYQIFFLNCELFSGDGRLSRRFSFREEQDHERLSESQEIIFYELPKVERRLDDFQSGRIGAEALTEEEKWCIYIRYRHEGWARELVLSLCREEEGIMRAEKSVVRVSRDYMRYVRKMAEIKNSMDRAQDLYEAQEEGLAKGHAEGLAEGHAEGLQEGIEQGRAEGRTEGHAQGLTEGLAKGDMAAKLGIARKMKNAQRPIDEIAAFTGLPLETIEQIG
jgi:predicted transposase/invertase (TIGR01784 family)